MLKHTQIDRKERHSGPEVHGPETRGLKGLNGADCADTPSDLTSCTRAYLHDRRSTSGQSRGSHGDRCMHTSRPARHRRKRRHSPLATSATATRPTPQLSDRCPPPSSCRHVPLHAHSVRSECDARCELNRGGERGARFLAHALKGSPITRLRALMPRHVLASGDVPNTLTSPTRMRV
jgi:hypothetical protein